MGNLVEQCTPAVAVSTHPLVQHKIAALRDERTAPAEFRRAVRTLAVLLAHEATIDLPSVECEVATPLGRAARGRSETWSESCPS